MRKKLSVISMIIALMMTAPAYAGQWRVDNTGWWYQEDNGSYPREAWRFINGSWYYFYSNGYMAHDAWISGLYYVGSDGRMLTNTITPDGYQVDANGKWVTENRNNRFGKPVEGYYVYSYTNNVDDNYIVEPEYIGEQAMVRVLNGKTIEVIVDGMVLLFEGLEIDGETHYYYKGDMPGWQMVYFRNNTLELLGGDGALVYTLR